ncbi:MAG TPA: phosphatase PAP2 family protein [Thermoanaerobaculia bacterium]|nr:phosphatase PAP2 family protein [Thermoanaerobaculia bacterium]
MLFALFLLLVFFVFYAIFFSFGPLLRTVFARLAHRTAKFRFRDYLPVVVILLFGFGATLLAGHLFEEIAEAVQGSSPALQTFDRAVHDSAYYARSDGSTRLFVIMTLIGTPVGAGIITAVVVAVLLLRKHWRWAVYLAFTGGVGGLLNLVLKGFFARARPDLAEALRRAHGYSFPSGHAMGSTIVWGALAYLAFRSLRGWRTRALAMSFACTMIVGISASRIYLGVHWISDVVAGIVAGLIWLLSCTVAYETFRRIRRVRERRLAAAAK